MVMLLFEERKILNEDRISFECFRKSEKVDVVDMVEDG